MVKSENIAIKVNNVSKSFKLPHEKQNSIKGLFVNMFRGKRSYEKQQVLDDISFEVREGDFLGIVGRNGSGKSTLLKLLAGIYSPDGGEIHVNGKLVPFIELGVGFNPDLTGRENVFLNGALLGFSRKEMLEMYDEIVEFAEIEKFMDQKLKNYSSGMQVRLAFSIAIRAKADILVLDEVLAVGDEAFQRKCNDYFLELKDHKKTVILVTHSMEAVRKYCDRAVFLRNGKLVIDGSPEDIANEYSLENLFALTKDGDKESTQSAIEDLKVKLLSKPQIHQEDSVEVQVSYKVKENISTKVYINLYDLDREAPVLGSASRLISTRKVKCTFSVKLSELNNTNFIVRATVRNEDDEILAFIPNNAAPTFVFRRTDYGAYENKSTYSLLKSRGEWK